MNDKNETIFDIQSFACSFVRCASSRKAMSAVSAQSMLSPSFILINSENVPDTDIGIDCM